MDGWKRGRKRDREDARDRETLILAQRRGSDFCGMSEAAQQAPPSPEPTARLLNRRASMADSDGANAQLLARLDARFSMQIEHQEHSVQDSLKRPGIVDD